MVMIARLYSKAIGERAQGPFVDPYIAEEAVGGEA